MRKRNKGPSAVVYAHDGMEERPSLQDLTVLQILGNYPGSAQALMGLHTQCVGCPMARFCTPRDVAGHYGLDLEALLALLRHIPPSKDP